MMNKITSFLSRLGHSRKFWLVASLVLSFLIWYGFKQYYNPTSTRTLRDVPVSFDVSNTAVSTNNLEIITRSVDSVEVVITGKTANIMKVSAADLTITPSLKDISKPGEYTVALNYTKSSIFSDFDVVSINPRTVDILVDSVATRTFDKLVAEANGITAPASSGLIKEMPYITDGTNSTLTVSGAQSKVDKIHTVVLRTDESKEISATAQFEAKVVLLDKKGKEISTDGLDLSFEKANITVSISKTKEVNVNAVFNNAPVKLFCDYSMDVSKVTLIGDPKTLDSLQKIDLMPIDYSQVSTDNNVFECQFNLPAGVRVHDGPQKVKVTVDTSTVRYKTIKVNNLEVTNVNSTLGEIELNNALTVDVYGNRSDVSKVTASNLTVFVNLGEFTKPGQYTVPATIKLDGTYDTLWVSTFNKEYTAYITIKQK